VGIYVNYQELKNIVQADILGYVAKWLPDGKQQGCEWVARNPKRDDNNPGSFSVNLDTGIWADFAAKGVGGSDITALYHYLYGNGDHHQSMISLANELAIDTNQTTKKPTKKPTKPKKVYPTPPDKVWINPTIGYLAPSQTWTYQNEQGDDVLIVYRFESEKLAKKEFRQLSRVEGGWSWGGLKQNPLYRLLDISLLPDKPIIFCEGEKPVDAAQQSIFKSDAIVTTTAGGSKNPHKTDFKPVKGRDVGIWRDNDEAGKAYAEKVARLALDAGAKSVRILPIPENWGEKWDAADVAQLDAIPEIVFNLDEWPQVELQHLAENNPAIKWPQKFIAIDAAF